MGMAQTLWIIILVGGPLLFGLVLMWGLAVAHLRDTDPPAPYDPTALFDIRAARWSDAPGTLADHGFGDRVTADGDTDIITVGELVAVTGGVSNADDNSVPATTTVRLASGDLVRHSVSASSEQGLRPGTWIPYHPPADATGDQEDFHPAWDLDRTELREVLITHRLRLGLVDVVDAAELVVGEPVTAAVHAIRATGQVHHGHVEVVLTVEHQAEQDDLTTLLRPEEIATARHSRQIPLVTTYDGRWLVWPTWY